MPTFREKILELSSLPADEYNLRAHLNNSTGPVEVDSKALSAILDIEVEGQDDVLLDSSVSDVAISVETVSDISTDIISDIDIDIEIEVDICHS